MLRTTTLRKRKITLFTNNGHSFPQQLIYFTTQLANQGTYQKTYCCVYTFYLYILKQYYTTVSFSFVLYFENILKISFGNDNLLFEAILNQE